MTVYRVVLRDHPHIYNRGEDSMEEKYDATYYLENTIVHVVAPPSMTTAEKERVLRELYRHAWDIWNLLPVEERLRINAEYDRK